MSDTIDQQYTIAQEEQERNYQAEQKEIIINDYFLFVEKIGKINYARGCAGGFENASRSNAKQKRVRCGSKSFDCGGAMKAYIKAKGIMDNIAGLNSSSLYELGNPVDPRSASRGDFMYRRGFGVDNSTGRMSTHFAVVSRDYTGGGIMRIYDNVRPGKQDQYGERAIRVNCNGNFCTYLGKYKIYISTNGAFAMAQVNNVEVVPRYDTTPQETDTIMAEILDPSNPEGYSVTINGFAYDSDANRTASYRYDNSSGDIDMIATFIVESHFDVNARGSMGEQGLCQLLYNKTNKPWLLDDRRNDGRKFQADVCLQKRQAVDVKSKIRMGFNVRRPKIKNIIVH